MAKSNKDSSQIMLIEIENSFFDICDVPEKLNLTVLMIHDITGLKKKDVRKMLEAGRKISQAYEVEHSFENNKKPKHRFNKDNRPHNDYDICPGCGCSDGKCYECNKCEEPLCNCEC